MEFRIADTFTDSLARLTGEEQKAVKTTTLDLQLNPAHPSLQFHKLDRPRDPNFCSVRISKDIRLIVLKTNDSLLFCYVAYYSRAAWSRGTSYFGSTNRYTLFEAPPGPGLTTYSAYDPAFCSSGASTVAVSLVALTN